MLGDLLATNLYTEGFVEIDQVVSGSGVHHILDQAVPCDEGDLCVLCPYTPHRYEGDETRGLVIRRILFDPQFFWEGDLGNADHPRFCYGVFCEGVNVAYATLNQETRREIEPLVAGLLKETQAERAEWKSAVGSYLSVLLITLSRYIKGAIRNSSSDSPKERELVLKAVRIINDTFRSADITLKSVSDALYVSQSHLSRCFERCMGKPFSDYLRELRMSHACALLKETDLTVNEILEQCGLRDVSSFYRSFQLYAHMTPTQYRNQYRTEQFSESEGEIIMTILKDISENLQIGKAKIVEKLVQQAIEEGCDPARILNEGLLGGMNVIGEKFKNNQVYVPEILVAARAMNMGLAVLKPHLISSGVQAVGKVCIGTVQGDLHDIGKNIVKMMLEGKGLEVVDLGVDVPAQTFIDAAKEQGCQVICCSALLTTTMNVMADVVKLAEEAGIRDDVKIMIGGAPVNEAFCQAIGADCYTPDAATAADAAVAFCKAE